MKRRSQSSTAPGKERVARLGLEDLAGQVDLALAIHVVHEATYPRRFLSQCRGLLRPGAKLLIIEPKGHVSDQDFESTRQMAYEVGFAKREFSSLKRSRTALFENPDR